MYHLKRFVYTGLSVVLLTSTWGCCSGMTGKVIDSETAAPIPNAVILAEWTKTSGLPGLTRTELFKALETTTDQEGGFHLSGVSNPFVNPPRITIYKKGYTAWNNEYIFPTWKKRTDFNWTKGVTIALEPFKKEYSRGDHVHFLYSVTHWGKLINQAFRWEELKYEKDRIK
jgi:hypothetical protein